MAHPEDNPLKLAKEDRCVWCGAPCDTFDRMCAPVCADYAEIIHQHGRYVVERVELLRPAVYGGWRVRCYLKAGFVVVSSPFANEALATNAARIAMSDGVRYSKA